VNTLENQIKNLAREKGAATVGIASIERMSGLPPSGDPSYLLASTQSIISFAIPYDREGLREYFGKKRWRAFGDDQKSILKILYGINDTLVGTLKEEGHEALGVDTNCVYRPETGAEHITDITEFVPDFSHQYGAVAAGLGRLGWSGNLLIPGYGAAILLGTVLTSAHLAPDPLCEQNPCDRCGLCTLVCPVQMMSPKKAERAIIAGVTEEIAARQPNTCCFIGCGDYHGLSPDGKWSNWSPYRVEYPLPINKDDLDAKLVKLRKTDPESYAEPNPYTDYRGVTFDPAWQFSATCGNCANICWKDREDREENMRLVVDTGVVVLNADGTRQATHEETLMLDTPYSIKVAMAVSEYKKLKDTVGEMPDFRGYLPKDREVLEYLCKNASKKSETI
jgi:epoxyqueuosine reductase